MGKQGETLHTFFLNDQKESKTSCSLSFERPKESEPKACPEAKPNGMCPLRAIVAFTFEQS